MPTTGSRDALERDARIIDAAAAVIPEALAGALARRGRDVALRFGDLVDGRLYATAAGDEIWVAIATRTADGRFVDNDFATCSSASSSMRARPALGTTRGLAFGELAWFEVARLGLREPT